VAGGAQVGRRHLAPHGKARGAESETRSDRGDQVILEGAALERAADDADVVAGRRLRGGEIEDVAKNAADRSAHEVDDAKTRLCHTLDPDGGRAPEGAATREKFASIVHGRP